MSDHPAGDGLDDVKKSLSHKIGPLPVGVWIAAIAGGLLIAYFVRKRSAAGDAAAGDERNTDTAPGVGGGALGVGGVVDMTQRPTDNQSWLNIAVERLVGKGYNPLVVYSALSRYLAGGTLSAQDQAIVSAAIRELGPPPEYVPPPAPGDNPGDGEGEGDGEGTIPIPTPGGSDLPGYTWDGGSGSQWNGSGELYDGVPAPPQGDFWTPEGVHGYVFPMHPTAYTVHWALRDDHSDAIPVGNRIGDNSAAIPSGKPTLLQSDKYKNAQKQGPGYIPPSSGR